MTDATDAVTGASDALQARGRCADDSHWCPDGFPVYLRVLDTCVSDDGVRALMHTDTPGIVDGSRPSMYAIHIPYDRTHPKPFLIGCKSLLRAAHRDENLELTNEYMDTVFRRDPEHRLIGRIVRFNGFAPCHDPFQSAYLEPHRNPSRGLVFWTQ